jgi:hypothetical protein
MLDPRQYTPSVGPDDQTGYFARPVSRSSVDRDLIRHLGKEGERERHAASESGFFSRLMRIVTPVD